MTRAATRGVRREALGGAALLAALILIPALAADAPVPQQDGYVIVRQSQFFLIIDELVGLRDEVKMLREQLKQKNTCGKEPT